MLHPELARVLAQERIAELHRTAAELRQARLAGATATRAGQSRTWRVLAQGRLRALAVRLALATR